MTKSPAFYVWGLGRLGEKEGERGLQGGEGVPARRDCGLIWFPLAPCIAFIEFAFKRTPRCTQPRHLLTTIPSLNSMKTVLTTSFSLRPPKTRKTAPLLSVCSV